MLQRIATLFAAPAAHPQRWLFTALAASIVLASWGAVISESWWLLGIPVALMIAWVTVVDFHQTYFLMLACIPISIEMELPGGLGTDLPSEPLMWVLTLSSVLWFLRNFRTLNLAFLRHPLTLILLAHLSWMTVAVVASEDFLHSFKFLLAKGWYVVVFYFLAGRIFQSEQSFRRLLWWFFVPLALTVMIVLARHGARGFTFKEVNYVMGPFYRNHVMYACLLAIFMPFLWYGTYWYKRWSGAWWLLVAGILLLLVGINFAFTRGAYVALLAAIGIYWVLRMRLLKYALLGFVLVLGILIAVIVHRDNWLEFAPDYQTTVTHTRFESLLKSTTKLKDISTMERVYRWVAASYMIQDHPWIGFGPGNFYFYYKNYTVTSFKTYVSGNPERSGIHNYYLMTTVEQGVPGLIFFLLLCFSAMLYGERIYHQTQELWRRRMVLAALLSFVLIAMLMLMNDFVETDKIGSLFFMTIAILVNMDLENRKSIKKQPNSLKSD